MDGRHLFNFEGTAHSKRFGLDVVISSSLAQQRLSNQTKQINATLKILPSSLQPALLALLVRGLLIACSKPQLLARTPQLLPTLTAARRCCCWYDRPKFLSEDVRFPKREATQSSLRTHTVSTLVYIYSFPAINQYRLTYPVGFARHRILVFGRGLDTHTQSPITRR